MKAKTKQEIAEFCQILKLSAVSEHYEELLPEISDPAEYLHKLLSLEIDFGEQKLIERRIRGAKFLYKKYLEDLDLNALPTGMQKRLPELITLDFIRNGQNLIITGNPGTGKTHTAIGLGIRACEAGYRVLYTTVPYLVTELKESNNQQKLRAY